MAAHHNQNLSGDLQDQVRQMILSHSPSGSPGPFDGNSDSAAHPAVRLPPSASYGQPPSKQSGPPPRQQNPNQNRSQPPLQQWQGNRNAHPGNFAAPFPGTQYGRQPSGLRQSRGNYAQQSGPRFEANGRSGPPQPPGPPHQQRSRYQQQMPLDPNAFQRGGFAPPNRGRGQGPHQLFNPNEPRAPMPHPREEYRMRQTQYLENVAAEQISKVDMSPAEYQEKESFRIALERICHEVCENDPTHLPEISLEPFGSFKSGYATAGSDMDLVIVVKNRDLTSASFSLLEDDLPRVLEKKLLDLGIGARLLTRTRVPIIKVCETPNQDFLGKLREEREKWDVLPEKEKYPHLHPSNDEQAAPEDDPPPVEAAEATAMQATAAAESSVMAQSNGNSQSNGAAELAHDAKPNGHTGHANGSSSTTNGDVQAIAKQRRDDNKPWTRERKAGPLDFPKDGVGIQCDINFFNPLGLHNTQLLRCYSLCDPRVKPIVLFVKSWAKYRKINSSYSGTLSSYGYVLMVLHYLINVANPPVLHNLQANLNPLGGAISESVSVDGWQVRFWRNEEEIMTAVQHGHLNGNSESVGSLLAGFFHYYSSLGGGHTFRWMNEVLSLRSQGGVLTKEEKGWVRAVTEEGEGKKIQHRYLFCIEDPFELSHNVARTVTHKGIVAIRDEFRRAHRILLSVGTGMASPDGELFDDLVEEQQPPPGTNGATADPIDPDGTMGYNERKAAEMRVKHVNQRAQATDQQQQQPQQQQHLRGNPQHRSGAQQQHSPANSKLFNPSDNDAFPALSTPPAKAPRSKRNKKSPPEIKDDATNYSEISGDKARLILEEVKRKKDEAQAESTATLAAESVLNGID